MNEKKRGSSGGKGRPQSIEQIRRASKNGNPKRPSERRDYSDGFSSAERRRPAPNRESDRNRNIYDLYPREERTEIRKERIPPEHSNMRSDSHKRKQRERQGQNFDNRSSAKERRTPEDNISQRGHRSQKIDSPAIKRSGTLKTKSAKQKKPASRTKLRFRRFILSFLAVSVVILVGTYLSLTVWFKTENIRVEGETKYTAERILEICTIKQGENIFLADKQTAGEAIKNALPYVEEADVSLSIPDTIIIKITEAAPAYQVGVADGYFAVSAKGRILEKMTSKLSGIPTLECSGLKNSEVGGYVEFESENTPDILSSVAGEIENLQISNITVIDITNTAKIQVLYDDRILIVLGVPEDINYKLRTAVAIIKDKLDPNNSGVIKGRLDVSVCNETKKSYFNENEIYVSPSQSEPLSMPSEEQNSDSSGTENLGSEPDSSNPSSGDISGDSPDVPESQ